MFDLANLGLVAWPTKIPDFEQTDKETGGNVMRTVNVRYEVFKRSELRELDGKGARSLTLIATERFADIGAETPKEGATREEVEAFYREQSERVRKATDEIAAEHDQIERDRIARLKRRVRAWQPDGGEWVEFTPEQLDALLEYQPYVTAFDDGLLKASRGAVAKN